MKKLLALASASIVLTSCADKKVEEKPLSKGEAFAYFLQVVDCIDKIDERKFDPQDISEVKRCIGRGENALSRCFLKAFGKENSLPKLEKNKDAIAQALEECLGNIAD